MKAGALKVMGNAVPRVVMVMESRAFPNTVHALDDTAYLLMFRYDWNAASRISRSSLLEKPLVVLLQRSSGKFIPG